MPPKPVPSTSTAKPLAGPYSHITATSQQSRFHAETIDKVDEIDLKDVSLSVGERELIVGSHLRLKAGVKYALQGRNGSGKTTLLQAIDQKLIPGIGKSIRILLLSQIQPGDTSSSSSSTSTKARPKTPSSASTNPTNDLSRNLVSSSKADGAGVASASTGKAKAEGNERKVLDWVIEGDKARAEAIVGHARLSQAIDSTSPAALHNLHLLLTEHHLQLARLALSDAQELSRRRSGARGYDARGEEVKCEEDVRIWEGRLKDVQEGAGEVDEKAVMDEGLALLMEFQMKLDTLDASTTTSTAARILSGLGFTQTMVDGPYSALSGGWRSRCQLAVALLIRSDVLMLDEPTNYLDLEAILWLERYLRDQTRTILITSHDQDFLENVVEETIVIRNHALKYFEGTPGAMEVQERKERRKAIKLTEAMDKKKDHIEKSIKQGIASAKKTGDENRMRMVKSRQKKLDDRWGLEANAKGHRFKLNRDMAGFHDSKRASVEMEEQEGSVRVRIDQPDPLRTTGNLLHFENVSFRWPKAKQAQFADVTFTLSQGGRLSLIGRNGEGKSTLVKLIMGEIQPTSGTIIRHPLMKVGYFSQHSVEALSGISKHVTAETTALGYFLDHFERMGAKIEEKQARACLGSFGLPGKLASEVPLLILSGGQKVRLAFALLVYRPPHLMVLDEITTHLDLATIQALARAVKAFQGGIVLVTHDRWFNRIVIEGLSFREAAQAYGSDENSEEDSSSSESDEDGTMTKKGETWRVDGGKVKLMANGMTQYVSFVERRLAKREAQDGT